MKAEIQMGNQTHRVVVSFKHDLCSSLPGEMIQFDEHIFQMGWFNHQLEILLFGERALPIPTKLTG